MYITANDLRVIRELILNKDVEACGFLLEHENSDRLTLYLEKYGERLGPGRGSCQTSKYTKYIWHTHSHNLLEYPSPQDIYNILKWHPNNVENNFPHTSVVFTAWGIWEISFPHAKFTLDQNWLHFLHKATDRVFHGLYHITREGLSRNALKYIQSIVNDIQALINREPAFDNAFGMSFTAWNKIRQNSSYFLKFA
uniref:Uncharacterized protein n=1 Tax=viral metagenome TaxID=1070528 RepID=A0A6C0EL97_9ZZZZ